MEKWKEGEAPIKDFKDLHDRPRLRELADSLKEWNLTPNALVFTRRSHSLAIREGAAKQLEELGRMSTRLNEFAVSELYAFGVGDTRRNSTIVDKFILPSQNRILVLKDDDIEVARTRNSRTLLEEYMKTEDGKIRDIVSLLCRVVNRKNEKDVELLRKFESRFSEIFVDENMTPEKILNTPWEMISSSGRVDNTKYYVERVSKEGIPVFGVHVHPTSLKPSPFDIYVDAGPKQRIEWTGILLARKESWWKFEIDENNFAVYYSDINNPKWLREIIARFSDEEFSNPRYFQEDFVRENKARMMKYGELLAKLS
ncbi:MAG: hypothetical protein QXF56_03195 [Candidatus Micrarchaeia archaeon]